MYSIRAVGRSFQLTVLLKYIDLLKQAYLCPTQLAIHVLYLYTKYYINSKGYELRHERKGMRAIRHNYKSLAPSNCSL